MICRKLRQLARRRGTYARRFLTELYHLNITTAAVSKQGDELFMLRQTTTSSTQRRRWQLWVNSKRGKSTKLWNQTLVAQKLQTQTSKVKRALPGASSRLWPDRLPLRREKLTFKLDCLQRKARLRSRTTIAWVLSCQMTSIKARVRARVSLKMSNERGSSAEASKLILTEHTPRCTTAPQVNPWIQLFPQSRQWRNIQKSTDSSAGIQEPAQASFLRRTKSSSGRLIRHRWTISSCPNS